MGERSVGLGRPGEGPADGSVGLTNFVARHDLWSATQKAAAREIAERLRGGEIEIVRFSFPDQHGLLRGKALVAESAIQALDNGVNIVTTLLAKDTAHRTVYPVFSEGGGFAMAEMTGAGDFIMVADPTSFRLLPWAPGTAWVLCDIYFLDGRPIPFSTRHIMRDTLRGLAQAGYGYRAGLEVEFHLFKLADPRLDAAAATQPASPPEVSILAHGFQYLTETRFDELEPAVEILRRAVLELGLPLRSTEVEYGPSQCEFTFQPMDGLDGADAMVLFRSAIKQVAHRHGYHATFMCRPALPNLFASGWHLHQSLIDANSGRNLFIAGPDDRWLSALGRRFVAGLIAHARAGSIFAAPTINAYKRYQPNSLAPDRAAWSFDNRGVMLRPLGAPGDPATRIENRAGDPAANPYLYMTAQILAGLDGIEQDREPPPPTDTPYELADAEPLPRSLMEAAEALRQSDFYRQKLGDDFVDYLLHIKDAEITRFLSSVTDWEQAEYFEMF